jgi:hypothetical protein
MPKFNANLTMLFNEVDFSSGSHECDPALKSPIWTKEAAYA